MNLLVIIDNAKTWKEHGGLVKMWINRTISCELTGTVLKPKSFARDLWLALENLFCENKENRALQLENELRAITIGDDLSVKEYCRKLKTLADIMANVDSPVSDLILVMHCLNGLNEKFDGIHNIIRHRSSPFPQFQRLMLQSEEDGLKKQRHQLVHSLASASSPNIIYVKDQASQHQNYNNRGSNKNHGCVGDRGNCGRGRNNNNSGQQLSGYSGTPNFVLPVEL
ncbi:unnamed protein product [Arabidopsis lyrata]|uniref:uncharacterized protein LOC110227751 n=1 Tax=Arabidopsis lyrata subsp. lyrata TaxID=81972 RepID=UPI000A29AEB9|nr:uncharacterized protein LOC110227751 [Arabidopsis lyrata subsp. lyrata]CAH8273492.1 unnamed protein product [Arabidopsis lyrata]|eukprot:XP_020878880.1 uncharacterized protein LOC110227751 [Arabidopsis lyrata subsp. lyrata]